MFLVTTLILVCFGIIAYQDFKDRAVLWTLFPLLGIFLVTGHLLNLSVEEVAIFSALNLTIVGLILSISWLYTIWVMKIPFLNAAFGLGDMLFFFAFALGFPTVTFLVLFVSSLLFSAMAFFILNLFAKMETVPLAGLMGIFLIGVVLISKVPGLPSLYSI
nr:general secretion pathway protein [uncultured Allomuricauda sp.]